MSTPTVRVFAYTRLSNDPEGKRADHVTQKRHIAEVCERYALPMPAPEDYYTDDDRSASKLKVERKDWLRIKADIKALGSGVVPVLVASARDRLTRRIEELPGLADLIEELGGRLITQRDGEINCTQGGREALYYGGVGDHAESERITKRTREGMITAALGGRRHGSVLWGWKVEVLGWDRHGKAETRDVIDTEAQDLLLTMADDLLSGVSLNAIVRRLNDAGVPAPGAGRVLLRDETTKEPLKVARSDWTSHAVRAVLTRKANIGVRVHRPGYGRDRTPVETRGDWPVLMGEALYARVCAVLAAPERRTSRTNVTQHWLSSIAVCGQCGQGMTAQPCKASKRKDQQGSRPTYTAYRCRRACVVKHMARVDAYVESVLMAHLQDPRVRAEYLRGKTVENGEDILTALEDERAKGRRLATLAASGGMDIDQFAIMNAGHVAHLKALEGRLTALRDSDVYGELLTCADVSAAWEAMELGSRRAVVASLFHVELIKADRRGVLAFDGPKHVKITYRQDFSVNREDVA